MSVSIVKNNSPYVHLSICVKVAIVHWTFISFQDSACHTWKISSYISIKE